MIDAFSSRDVAEDSALPADLDLGLIDEHSFSRIVAVERKRTERSCSPFLLMLLEAKHSLQPVNGGRELLRRLVSALRGPIRETDSIGWYKKDFAIGVVFTEVGVAAPATMSAILTKVTTALRSALSRDQLDHLTISLHRYPQEKKSGGDPDLVFYPDLPAGDSGRTGYMLKRAMDIALSSLGLLLTSPLFLAIALAIKLTSKGPVLVRQARIGHCGVPFTFFKFRSMYVNSDHSIHKDYVSRFISGESGLQHEGRNGKVYKITKDPRVTPLGSFLRKSSLDELPQLFNVLKGEMSLVGPRPPLPYEFECYDVWHRRRVVGVKPGITGLWQVSGRSRTSFDEMVRLDLKYADRCSIWLDMNILFRTPLAVLSGNGAY